MRSTISPLLLLLSAATLSNALDFVSFDVFHLSNTWGIGQGGYAQNSPLTEAACAQLVENRAGAIGYIWGSQASTCQSYTTYPTSLCENGAPKVSAVPAPYKRKRKVVEPSPYIGGKICPIGEQACPLASTNAFECINIKENLASCGGCLVGKGVDCSDIPGTDEVSCRNGSCVVDSCIRGWSLSTDGDCIAA